jgi:hypothetical protein
VVVLVLVAEAKGGGGGGAKVPGIAAAPKSSGGAAPKVAPAVHAAPAARVATGTGVRVAPVPHGGRGGFRPAPAPGTGPVPRVRPAPVPYVPAPHGGVVVYGGVDVNLWYPWYPCCDYWGPYPYPATVTETTTVWTAPPAATDVAPYAPALAPEGDELAFEDGELEPEPPRPVEQLQLGKVQPLPVDKRGFFDGDDMVIELVVVDRMTGEPRLRKVARRAIDPCDVKAVRQLLQDTLKKGTWERLSPASS